MFSSYYLSLPATSRTPFDGKEKYLLRSSFSNENLIPPEILWRVKEGVSDGVSKLNRSLYTVLQDHINKMVSVFWFILDQK